MEDLVRIEDPVYRQLYNGLSSVFLEGGEEGLRQHLQPAEKSWLSSMIWRENLFVPKFATFIPWLGVFGPT